MKKALIIFEGEGTYKNICKKLELLKSHSFRMVSGTMVLSDENYEHINEFEELCKVLRLKPALRTITPTGRALENIDILNGIGVQGKCDRRFFKHTCRM